MGTPRYSLKNKVQAKLAETTPPPISFTADPIKILEQVEGVCV